MKEYLKLLKKLIEKSGKAKIAVNLNVKDTRTIDRWFEREMIPSKYLDKIKEMK